MKISIVSMMKKRCSGYIDPGLGGLIIQSLIAGCLTVVYFFRNTISKFFGGIKRLFKKEESLPKEK